MEFRRAVGLAAVDVGPTTAANAAFSKRAKSLELPLSGPHGTYRWRGMDVSYVEAGSEDDPTLICLHGIDAVGSPGEFCEVFSTLAEDHCIVTPDPPGFGLSGRPTLYHSPALYEDFAGGFLAEYDDSAVLTSSLATAYAIAVVERDDTPVSRFVLVCPTSRGGPDPKEWFRELVHASVVGEAPFNVAASRPSIRHFSANHGYYDPEKAGEEWQEYEWRATHQEGTRSAPTSFTSGYLNTDINLGGALAMLDVPTTLVWNRESDVTLPKWGHDLAGAADCTFTVLDDAVLLPRVELPNTFVDTVCDALD